MNSAAAFLASFATTLVALAVTVWSGHKGRLRVHLPSVVASLACLGVTIFFAERLGEEYDLESAGWIKPVHLTLAKSATASYLLPLVSGILTLRDRRYRKLHLALAMLTLLLTVLAAATGTLMILRATPLG